MKNFYLLLLIWLPVLVHAQGQEPDDAGSSRPQSLTELITEVREGSATRRAELAAREQRFIDARNEQEDLLEQAAAQRAAAEAEADRLRELYQQGEDELAQLEDLLAQRSGDLTDVFSVVNQVSGDALPVIQNSMVSAQYPDRLPLLETLSSAESIPTAQQLRELWLLLLDEMLRSGQVARFEAPIIAGSGDEETRQVTRIGTFTALSQGQYLRFLPESGRLLALARQPVAAGTGNALAFEQADSALQSIAIDPSRGSILSLVIQSPELSERIRQGGVIGYVILALGAIGLLLGVERLVVLIHASRQAQRAAADSSGELKHPINTLRSVANAPEYLADVDAMSAKMDEIVTTAGQQLRRGLPTLAIFAAVSPLLGLLGTVTGMIETFQVITLFGAGDPRLMSGGISQALVTTQLGLAVAIPLLLIHSWLQGRANSLIAQLDETAADQFAQGRADRATHAE